MSYQTLISTRQLAAELDRDPRLCVVDCRYDLANPEWGLTEYRRGHIPGASYVSLSHDLAGPPSDHNGRHPLPAVEAMTATFSRIGIDRGTPVVAYDQENGMYASRLWWMLRYLGHDEVAVLDGGWAKWTAEHLATRQGDETRSAANFVPRVREAMVADVGEVERLVADRSALLVDARAPERFEGRVETLDRTAGHIPGARNHFFKSNLTDAGTMLPPERLREAFAATLAGHKPEAVVMYCGSGVTACQNLLAMAHAGIRGTRLYPGSWSEWSSDAERPVETGPATGVSRA
jgi:thiosulfate/3-mercaptopyruvate sulfurtransferase